MLGQVIWWGCIAFETLLLVRGFQAKLWARYPVFYTYVSFVWLQSLLRFSILHSRPRLYGSVYWITEWLGVLIGCAVVFEIYRVALAAYPGTARIARNLLGLVFVLAFSKALVDTWNDPQWWLIATTMDLERALRIVQGVAIAALIALFFFYSIPFGRNLRGVLLGYGLFIFESVTWLTLVPLVGGRFREFWYHVHPASYFVVLGVWLVHMWSYVPSPEPNGVVRLEEQYQNLATATTQRLRAARGYLAKAVRP